MKLINIITSEEIEYPNTNPIFKKVEGMYGYITISPLDYNENYRVLFFYIREDMLSPVLDYRELTDWKVKTI